MRTLLALLTMLAVSAPAAEKPNFIFISIDDLGYADIEPFGSKLNRTPNLNRMASEGRKLTSFYAAPVCSPSRAALMTGCYPKRALPIPHVLFPGNAEGLHPDEVTVAELLKEQGYATGIIGKWHLGDQPEFLPAQQGFDYWYGLPYSNDMGPAADGVKSDLGKPLPRPRPDAKGQPPLALMRKNTVLRRVMPDDQQSLVELYTDEAIQFLREHRAQPFFLYLPHNAVHFPIYPGKKFAGQSTNGIYSDWVEEVDWSVGRVLDVVRELKLEGKTLVIFTSDNGGTPRGLNTPLRGHKNSTWEGGMRVPTIAWWPGKIQSGTSSDAITGMFDILPTFVKLAGGKLPSDRTLDGRDIWPVLGGASGVKGPHQEFFFFKGLKLEAVRSGFWKLRLGTNVLHNLYKDIGENTNIAAAHPEIVARLQVVADRMKDDLGHEGIGPGCRELGKAVDPKPIIDHDGNVRPELRVPTEKKSAAVVPQTETSDRITATYKTVEGKELKLSIVKPPDWMPGDKRPAIVFFFGGGWVSGKRGQFARHSEHLATRGMVCFEADYRLLDKSNDDPPLRCVQDAKSALRWVRSHAAELGIDPQRIAAGGGSAGGHLAAFTGLCDGLCDGLDDPADDLRVSPRPNALVLFNPVFDNGPDQGWGHQRVKDRYREFSPAHNITREDPPAIVFLGTKDALVPVSVAQRFQTAMKGAGVKCELFLYEGQLHGFFNYGRGGSNRYYTETVIAADKFLTSLGWLQGEPTLKASVL